MQVSLLLAREIVELFLILLMGVAVVRTGLLRASDSKVVSVLLVYLVIPCVILNAFQIEDTPQVRTGLLYALGIAAGVLLYLLKIPLPGPLLDTMDSMGNLMGPLCMLLAGMAIAESPLRRLVGTARYYLACALRLLVYPLAVLVILWAVGAAGWIPDGKSVLMTVFLATITPACATITSMAQLYDCDVKKSSSLYVLSTLLSLVTMPIMLGLFDTLL